VDNFTSHCQAFIVNDIRQIWLKFVDCDRETGAPKFKGMAVNHEEQQVKSIGNICSSKLAVPDKLVKEQTNKQN